MLVGPYPMAMGHVRQFEAQALYSAILVPSPLPHSAELLPSLTFVK